MISNSDLHMLLLINFTDITMTEQLIKFNCNFLKSYNTTDYITPNLYIGYQYTYVSPGRILISSLVVSYTMHLSFKNHSTLLGHFFIARLFSHRVSHIFVGKYR